MKNNINTKIGATLLSAAILAGTAVIPMTNAAVVKAAKPTIKYSAHVQDHGWMAQVNEGELAGTTGESRRVEAFKFELVNCPNVTLNIKAHVQDHGDMNFTVTAADTDKLVGTQWEQRRIEAMTITTTGLKELGYKLQYRVHVQDYGWQDWKDEGTMAGTMYEAKRLEAVEFRMVEDMNATKLEYINTLSDYKAVLKAGNVADYDNVAKAIETAISEIRKSSTNASAKEIFDDMVAEIKNIDSKVATKVEAVVTAREEAKETALKTVKFYEEALADVKSELTSADVAIINQVIAKATVDINNAEIADDATSAEGILETTMEEYEKLKAVRELKEEQAKAYETISQYEEALKNVTGDYKNLVEQEISNAETAVRKAETVDNVQDTMANLADYIKAYYSEIVEEILTSSINDAVKKLNSYLNYTADLNEDEEFAVTSALLSKYETVIEEVTNIDMSRFTLGTKSVAELAKEYIADVKTAKTDTEVATKLDSAMDDLKDRVAITKVVNECVAEDNKKLYDEKFEEIKVKLDEYKSALETLKVDTADRKDINDRIDNTVAKAKAVTLADDVQDAFDSFEAYMEAHYSNIYDNMKDAALTATRKEALTKVEEYKKLDVYKEKTVSDAVTALEEVAKNTNKTAADIKTAIDAVEEAIANVDFAAVKDAATKELMSYLGREVTDTAAIKAAVEKGIEDIENATTVAEVNKAKTKAISAINEILKDQDKIDEEALEEAREEALKTMNEYVEMATDYNESALARSLRSIRSSISITAKTTAEIDNLLEQAEELMSQNDLLTAKKAAVKALEDVYKVDSYPYINNVDYADIKAVVDDAIEDIKVVTKAENIEKISNNVATDVKVVTDAIDALETVKTKALADLGTVAGSPAAGSALEKYMNDVVTPGINGVSKNTRNPENKIAELVVTYTNGINNLK